MAGPYDENPLSAAAPKRNPGLIQRILRAVVKQDPAMGPQPLQQQTTATGEVHPAADFNDQFFVFKTDAQRQATYRDADQMDEESDEVSTALDIIADNATTSEDGTQLSFEAHSEDSRVQKILDEVVATAGLKAKTKALFRNLVKYGDFFGEPVINGELKIVDLRFLPPHSMARNQDKFGQLATGSPKYDKQTGKCENKQGEVAFEQIDMLENRVINAFEPWQVIHGRLDHDGFTTYGRSHLRVARIVWRQLKALIEALVIGRLTRDLLKLVFYVDTTGLSPAQRKQVLREFKESVSTRAKVDFKRENPFSVLTDFYLSDGYVRVGGQAFPMRTKLDVIDPKNEGIHDITDIKFLHRKLLMDLRVPPAHMSWEEDTGNGGILTQQDVQYVRWLRSLQREVGVQILEPLFNLALILNGIDPKTAEYTIEWPALKATDEAAAAQTTLAFAQADQLYIQEGVLSPSYVQMHRFGMDEEEMAAVQEENEQLQQQAQQQAMDLATHQASLQTGAPKGPGRKGPKDNDGQRKGDEGRDKNGKRIAPTKSKKGVNNPSGTGTGQKKTKTVKAAGAIDPHNAIVLEKLSEHFSFERLDRAA